MQVASYPKLISADTVDRSDMKPHWLEEIGAFTCINFYSCFDVMLNAFACNWKDRYWSVARGKGIVCVFGNWGNSPQFP